jgi:cytoskeletal protein RodZ
MESLGGYLRRQRELQQLSVAEIAQTTRIPARVLRLIENDRFDELPADVFVRGFLRAYARAVGIDEAEVMERYERTYRPEPETAASLVSVSTVESGRSFGLAIALVILLILFTLALSIVLRPRYRNAPVELSRLIQVQEPCGSDIVSVQALDSAAAKAPEKPSAPAGPARSVPTYMTSRPEDAGAIRTESPQVWCRFFGMDWSPSFHRALPPPERLRDNRDRAALPAGLRVRA